MESLEDPWPEAGLTPQPIATIDRMPWAELGWELVPGGIGAEDPEDAGQDGAGGPADSPDRCSRSKQWLHADPLGLGQVRPVRHRSSSARRCGGRSGTARRRACSRPRQDMAAAGDRLVGPSPPGPAQMKIVMLDGLGQQVQQTADLGHGQRDQLVSGASPF